MRAVSGRVFGSRTFTHKFLEGLYDAHCYRKLATEMFASEFQFVSPRDAPLIRRNFAELDFSVCEEFAFSVERAPITVDIDVHPLLLRHKHEVDTKEKAWANTGPTSLVRARRQLYSRKKPLPLQ